MDPCDSKQAQMCREEFARTHETQATIVRKLEMLDKKLFIGNGKPGLATIVYGHDLQLRLLLYIGGSVMAASIAAIVGLWFRP